MVGKVMTTNLQHNLDSFLNAAPNSYPFPMGGETEIPMESENELLDAIQQSVNAPNQDWPSVGEKVRQGYQCAVFAVRMAVYAVRKNNKSILEASAYGLVFSNGQVDWRDLLKALSIMDDCCRRLDTKLENILPNSVDRNGMQDTIKGYLLRESEMREIGALGIHTEDTPEGLVYKNRY